MAELKLTISEYGKEVRTYSDNNKERFIEQARRIIDEHITKHCHQSSTEIKNTQFHIATY